MYLNAVAACLLYSYRTVDELLNELFYLAVLKRSCGLSRKLALYGGGSGTEGLGIELYHTLAAGMLKLDDYLRAVSLNGLSKSRKRLYMSVLRYGKLAERAGAVLVVYAGNTGDDDARASLCASLKVGYNILRRSAVEVCKTVLHCRHYKTVLRFQFTYFAFLKKL